MCDACVMNVVKEKMLSRRHLFKSTAAAAGAAGAASLGLSAAAPSAQAAAHSSIEDLTHTLHEGFPTYFGDQQFFMEQKFNFAEHFFNLFELRVNEHTGTHIDAPLHFSEDGLSVDEIPVTNLVAPLCVVNITEKAEADPSGQVTPADIEWWIKQHGEIPAGACVAMHSGWARKVDSDSYRGFYNEQQNYPGFHVEAAQMLIEAGAGSIAVDTLSLDHGPSQDFATHYAWLSTGRFGIENIANLDRLPPSGATIIIGAPKHRGGTGGPARVLAMV